MQAATLTEALCRVNLKLVRANIKCVLAIYRLKAGNKIDRIGPNRAHYAGCLWVRFSAGQAYTGKILDAASAAGDDINNQ